ncbi:protein ACCELERATED CELL DEATH 6-like [Macadamia integrifolia]|uniref:protein ACCELERATED CELL DEATH 6-like n=1 Tax=Macadamia integrifolia TaxID=60698 RepID=UPI001C4E87EC|nr:protein ACCELERATED CELL DEATH 6-like [Macadamia integrifolia]
MNSVLYKNVFEAVTKGDSDMISRLLEGLGDDLTRLQLRYLSPLGIHRVDENQDTLLHIAAYFEKLEVVKVIHECLPTIMIRSKNYRGDTALHIAARYGNAEVVEYLLRCAMATEQKLSTPVRYPTAKVQNRDGNTALHEAVLGHHLKVIEVLMNLDKEVIFIKNKNKESPLYLAADCGLEDVLEKMLEVALEDPNFNRREDLSIYDGPDGRTPLHAAIGKKHKSCIDILLKKKKELIRTKDKDGRTPLYYASSLGHSEEARFILVEEIKDTSIAHQKDNHIAHQKDNQGLYPIHIAAKRDNLDIIKAIVDYLPGAIKTLNNEDQNVIHLAAKSGSEKLVSYMLHPKSNLFHDKLLNAKDIKGNTPLHLAVLHSHPNVVNILLWDRKKIDMTIENDERLTARDIAEKQMCGTISMPKFLCRTALRIINAPSGQPSPIIEDKTSTEDNRGSVRPSPIIEDNTSKDIQNIKNYKGRFDTLVLVATLIFTVTFTAGFTAPGGFNSDGPYKGMATLFRKPLFDLFVICNTMAFYLSIVIVVNNICAQLADIHVFILAAKFSSPLLGLALIMTAVAFAAGLYSVILKLQWLAVLVLVIGSFFLFYMVYFLLLINVPHKFSYLVPRCHMSWRFYLFICKIDRTFDNIDWLSGVKEV